MDFRTSQRLGNTTYIITLEELPQEKLNGFVSPSQEAVYIHFISAITSSHRVGVQISITPFCLREFPGQVFYFAEGIYVRCCAHIKREDILAPINEAAQVIYTRAVSWHTWNLRAPDIWKEHAHPPPSPPSSPPQTCTRTIHSRLHALILSAQASEIGLSSSPTSTTLTDPSLPSSNSSFYAPSSPGGTGLHTRVSSSLSLNYAAAAAADEETGSHLPPSKRKRRGIAASGAASTAELVASTADTFLERLRATHISSAECLSYTELAPLGGISIGGGGDEDVVVGSSAAATAAAAAEGAAEHVSRAWEMCICFAQQSNRKLKYARFLRFLSLCFFLIWERGSQKQGKSAAREVNSKMREAGFSGHSRGLKTMRDETTLINTIIASIQTSRGCQKAGILYHVIFEASNYQLIRTINRLGKEKQTSIIQYICENVDIDALIANETSAMDVQGIIQQHLPELSTQAIDAAIGYEAICNRSTESVGNPTGVPIGMSGYLADELALPSELVADSSTGLEGFDVDMVTLDGMQGAPSHYHLLPFSEGVGGMVFDFAYDDMDMGQVIG